MCLFAQGGQGKEAGHFHGVKITTVLPTKFTNFYEP